MRNKKRISTGSPLSSRSLTPVSATAGSAVWLPVSWIPWPPCSFPPWVMVFAMNTACSGRPSRTAGSRSSPTIGCAGPTRGKWLVRTSSVEIKLNCSFEMRDGGCAPLPESRPAFSGFLMIGLLSAMAERPSTRSGSGLRRRRTTLTFRNSAAAISSARWPRPWPPNPSPACFIPTIPPAEARRCASCRNISSSPARSPISCAASGANNKDWSAFPDKVAIQLNDTHPDHGRPGIDAHPARRGPPRLGSGLGHHPKNPRLHQSYLAARSAGKMAGRTGSKCCCRVIWRSSYEINRRLLDDVRKQYPGDEGTVSRISLIEEGATAQGPHGQSRHCRLAQHQWRSRDPFQAACARRPSKISRRCFRSASTTRPTA